MDARVRRALDLLQTAQGLIGEAAGLLSATPDYDDEPHARLCRLYDAVKSEWHRVNDHRHTLTDGRCAARKQHTIRRTRQ